MEQRGGIARQQRPFTLIAPFLRSALLLGVAAGFLLAAVLTVTRALGVPLGSWWVVLAQAHGHVQVYGWAGLFVFGVALHFLPRLRGAPLAAPQLVPWILGGLLSGLVLRTLSQPLLAATGAPIWGLCLRASGFLEGLALLSVVAVIMLTTLRQPPLRARAALWSILPFVLGVCVSLVLAAVTNMLNMWRVATVASGVVPAPGDQLNVTCGLFGFLVPMALAMSARSLPTYAGLEAFALGRLWPLTCIYLAGVALSCIGLVLPGGW